MSNFDRRALMEALKQDASRMGISVPALIQRITSGAHVIGAGQPREMIDPPTHMDTGEGQMPQIRDVQEGAEDDWDQLVRERSEALEQAGGDDLAANVLYRHRVATQLPDGSPAPPSAAKGGLLGSQLVVTQACSEASPQVYGGISTLPSHAAPKNVQAVQVATWTSDNDFETRPVTVTFQNLGLALGFASGPGFRPFGLVQFGTRDVSSPLYVDICRGCQFTVAASSVQLFVGLDPVAVPGAAQQVSLALAGMISFNPVVRTTPIYRTVYLDKLVTGTNPQVNVPPFANRMWIMRNDPANTAITIQVLDSNTSLIYEFDLAAAANQAVPIPLSSDASIIVVTKTAGADLEARLIFELGL